MTRFPTYPRDILDRADALLSSKYPDGIVDPRFVEVACEAMMAERGRIAEWADVLGDQHDVSAILADDMDGLVGHRAVEQAFRNFAKAIRGTE